MAEDRSVLVPLDDLGKNPYREILAYPKPSDESVDSRIRQLKSLGIEGLEFEGPLRIGKLWVLGKGVVGLVVAGIADGAVETFGNGVYLGAQAGREEHDLREVLAAP